MLRFIFSILIAINTALPLWAVDTATPTPATVTIPETGNAFITIRWRVTINDTVTPSGTLIEITGAPAVILIDATPFAIPSNSISRRISYTNPTQTVTLIERIRIPRNLALAIANGATTTYSRDFSDSVTVSTATGTANLQTGSNSALGFREFDLAFDDASKHRTVGVGYNLSARLDLSFSGRGQLRGEWQVAGPDNIQSFKRIGFVSRSLTGNRRVVVESPVLPTERPGIYRLRFRPNVQQPSLSGNTYEQITYVVTEAEAAAALGLNAPAAGDVLTPNTIFSWDAIANAAGYRLEILRPTTDGSGDYVSAQDLKSNRTTLSPITLSRTIGKTGLTWRISAYDSDGRLLARSVQRKFGK